MNKVLEIELIENTNKKKKSNKYVDELTKYKSKIINDLEDVICLKFFKNENPAEVKQLDKFVSIKNRFITFYNSYIQLNLLFISKTKENIIVRDIIDEMVENVLHRVEKLNLKKNIIEIELLKSRQKVKEEDLIDISMIS